MAGPHSEAGTATEWYANTGDSAEQLPQPPQGSTSSAGPLPTPEEVTANLVKEVYKTFGHHRVLVPQHLRQLLDSAAPKPPKPWQAQIKVEAQKVTQAQQKLQKLTQAMQQHRSAWQSFEEDLKAYHAYHQAVFADGCEAWEQDAAAARLEELTAKQELATLARNEKEGDVIDLEQDQQDEQQDMEQDQQVHPSPTPSQVDEMEASWYQDPGNAEAQRCAQAQWMEQQQQQRRAAEEALASQAAAQAAVQQAQQEQQQRQATAEATAAQQAAATAADLRMQQEIQAQQEDLKRILLAQQQRQAEAAAAAAAVQHPLPAEEEEEESMEVGAPPQIPTFKSAAMRSFRSMPSGKRQATAEEVFREAPESKKKD